MKIASILIGQIKKVWVSRWNERTYISAQKVKVEHNDLCMAVMV